MNGRKLIVIASALGLALLVLVGASGCASGSGKSGKGGGATRVEFIVIGSAPSGVDITYGSANSSSRYQGHLPMNVTKTIQTNPLYYNVRAQLQGSGHITCKVILGTAKKVGHATGEYGICSAQLSPKR